MVKAKVQAVLDVIQESDSDYVSPTIQELKKCRYEDVCGLSALNRFTVNQRYPLPFVNDQFDKQVTVTSLR